MYIFLYIILQSFFILNFCLVSSGWQEAIVPRLSSLKIRVTPNSYNSCKNIYMSPVYFHRRRANDIGSFALHIRLHQHIDHQNLSEVRRYKLDSLTLSGHTVRPVRFLPHNQTDMNIRRSHQAQSRLHIHIQNFPHHCYKLRLHNHISNCIDSADYNQSHHSHFLK